MNKIPTDKDKKRFQRAMQALNGGQSREAIRLFDKVLKSGGSHPDIWYLLGLAHGKLGEMKEVKQVSLRALETQPNHFGALCNLANALMAMGNKDEALENYAKALKAKPGDPTVVNNYGRALGLLGRWDEAIKHFNDILQQNKNYAPAHTSLGRAYAEGGYPEKALSEFRAALALDNRQTNAHLGIGNLYARLGGLPYAEHHYKAALDAEPKCIDARLGLGSTKCFVGHFQEALEILAEAERYAPNLPSLLAAKADVLERMADYDGANKILKRLKKEKQMNALAVSVFSHLCRRFGACEEAVELLEKCLEAPQYHIMEKQMMRYDMGRLLDRLERYDDAFKWYREANETVVVPCRIENDEKRAGEIIGFFSEQVMQSLPRANTGSKRPIFILGMPRSGTSLTEQILASHPDVYGAGELRDVKQITRNMEASRKNKPIASYIDVIAEFTQQDMNKYALQYLDSIAKLDAEAPYVTDKMPHNFLLIGVISLLFPEARIIHCRRDPLDNALSIYFQNFSWTHDYAVNLATIGRFYKVYERYMQHWEKVVDIPIMTVQYEDMVEDQETMSRQLIEFCGLEWDDQVLDFHGSERAIATASYDQVRQPIYKTSRERWRKYEKHLGPLIEALEGRP
ncbi:sulfotransferase [Pseudomonadota bacterium]